MKAMAVTCVCLLSILAGCSGWPGEPYTYHPDTVFPSNTPRIQTATPLVLSATPQSGTETETLTPTVPTPSETPTMYVTPTPASVAVDILGCDTGIDVLHGMGEVTNAYVTISNATGTDLENVCATLRGLDEARTHPDKTKCIPSLPSGYQVTLKLTVDTTYKEATPIQVDVTTGDSLLARAGQPACEAIGLLLPGADEMGLVQPIPTP